MIDSNYSNYSNYSDYSIYNNTNQSSDYDYYSKKIEELENEVNDPNVSAVKNQEDLEKLIGEIDNTYDPAIAAADQKVKQLAEEYKNNPNRPRIASGLNKTSDTLLANGCPAPGVEAEIRFSILKKKKKV